MSLETYVTPPGRSKVMHATLTINKTIKETRRKGREKMMADELFGPSGYVIFKDMEQL